MSGSFKLLAFVVLTSALAIPRAVAQSEAFVQQRAAARAEVVKGLTDLAAWCDSKQLYLERDRIYAQLIVLEPDHADARKGLRHKRGPDGKWPALVPTKSMNRDPKALLEFPAERTAVVGPFSDKMLELVDGADGDGTQRQAVYDEILLVDPEEARVHEKRGDVKVDGKWLMKETVAHKQQREKIRALVKKCMAEVPKGASTTPNADELKLVSAWRCTLATDDVRVLSTGDNDGCERMVQAVQAAGALIDGMLGTRVSYPGGYTIYLLGPEEKATFIERLPEIPDKDRKMMLGTAGGGIPSTNNNAIWDTDPKVRLDMAVRLTYQNLLRSAYGFGSKEGGFASEGLGLYFTREILGTRLTWWVIPTKVPRGEFFSEAVVTQDVEAQATRARLMQADSNWLNEALKLFDAGSAPHLAQVTRRHVDSMSTADILVSYAFIAYLLEGHPEQANEFFVHVGSGTAEEASKATFDLTLADVEKRLHRWLKEVR